jgi:hypothetical protein
MAVTGRTTAICVFDDRADAERAVDDLYRAGFAQEDVGIAMRRTEVEAAEGQGDSRTLQGAATGAVSGAAIGGVIGALAVGLVPGLGPVLAGGLLASILGGAAVGGTAGGLIGALAGMGVPEEEARYYDEQFRAGSTIVTVRAQSRYEEASEILRRHGGRTSNAGLPSRDDYVQSATPPGVSTGSGYVPGEHEAGYPGITYRAESGYNDWEQVREGYRRDWEARYGRTDRRWEYDEPGYRFGYQAAHDRRFHGRQWNEIEPELRDGYEEWAHRTGSHEEERSWGRAKENVRLAWERETGQSSAP